MTVMEITSIKFKKRIGGNGLLAVGTGLLFGWGCGCEQNKIVRWLDAKICWGDSAGD